jgi:molybdopterin synthase sulfur carrier subunit
LSSVRVRYFAELRETLGVGEEEIPVGPEGASLAELLEHLAGLHGDEAVTALVGPGIRLAVNGELDAGTPPHLHAGDELAFLPPVTGG